MNKVFSNKMTREVFVDVLLQWGVDHVACAREWIEMNGPLPEAIEALAHQLKKDISQHYSEWCGDDELGLQLVRFGLYRVDWYQVAKRLLEAAKVQAQESSEDDAGEDDAGDDGGAGVRA
jgi:hypothetical protein